LELSDAWRFELAAMLSQIGCMTLPSVVLEKVRSRTPLSDEEKSLFASHPVIACKLLEDIPRIEPIPLMIREQQKPFIDYPEEGGTPEQRKAVLGAQILNGHDYENAIHDGISHQDVVQNMLLHSQKYNPNLVNALGKEEILEEEWVVKMLYTNLVKSGMVANEDIISKDGNLIVSRGQIFSTSLVERLKLSAKESGVVEPFSVLTPNV
jgi:hypothetical protein